MAFIAVSEIPRVAAKQFIPQTGSSIDYATAMLPLG